MINSWTDFNAEWRETCDQIKAIDAFDRASEFIQKTVSQYTTITGNVPKPGTTVYFYKVEDPNAPVGMAKVHTVRGSVDPGLQGYLRERRAACVRKLDTLYNVVYQYHNSKLDQLPSTPDHRRQ